MAESFGARLRRRREERAIALLAIADQTKIKLSLLEALERDDVSHWPSGIFRRAYIRAYADAIGLDPDVVVHEFLEVHPEPEEIVAATWPMSPAGDAAPAGPAARLRELVGSALGSLSRHRLAPPVATPAPSGAAAGEIRLKPDATATAAGKIPPSDVRSPTSEVRTPKADAQRRISPTSDPAHRTSDFIEGSGATRPHWSPDFEAVGRLCTQLARIAVAEDMQRLLPEAAAILDAAGLIVWLWDAAAACLRPVLAHGYSDTVLAHLPVVRRDADNGTAAAFRSAQTCVIEGSSQANGALVIPLMSPAGCAGVLALELQHGGERARSVQAAATILAAMFAVLAGGATSSASTPSEAAASSARAAGT